MKKLKQERTLTKEEKMWLTHVLKTYYSDDIWKYIKTKRIKQNDKSIKFFLNQMKNLRVYSICDCKNCKEDKSHTIDFKPNVEHKSTYIMSDVIKYKPNLSRNILISIEEENGDILSMEII